MESQLAAANQEAKVFQQSEKVILILCLVFVLITFIRK